MTRPCLKTRLAIVCERSSSKARRANAGVAGLRRVRATRHATAGSANGAKDGYQTGPNPIRSLVAAAAVALLASSIAAAQQKAGPTILLDAGFGGGSATVEYRSDVSRDSCSCERPAGSTASSTLTAGIGVAWPLGSIGGMFESSHLVTRVSFTRSRLDWIVEHPDGLVLLPGTVEPIVLTMETRLGYVIRDLGFETLLLFSPVAGLDVGIGGAVSYREIVDFEHGLYIIEPESFRFREPWGLSGHPVKDDGHTLLYSDGSDLDFNSLGVQAMVAVRYTMPIDESMAIIPEIDYRADLVEPIRRSDWSWHSVTGLISFAYSL